MKIVASILTTILVMAIFFFGGVGIYSAVTHKPYGETLIGIFTTKKAEEKTDDNKIETENAVIYFNF